MSKLIDALFRPVTKFVDMLRSAGDAPRELRDLPSRAGRVRHADLAAVAARRRMTRHVVLSAVRRNTRGLPLGMARHVINAARDIERRARRGQLENVSETRIDDADKVLGRLSECARVRARVHRPTKTERRMRPARARTCTPKKMIEAQKARRSHAFA